MRKLLFALFLLSAPLHAQTYFGNTDPTGATDFALNNYIYWNDGVNIIYTCPGSGVQNITEMGAYVKANTAIGPTFRMALFSSAGAFITQWSQAKQAALTAGWITDTSFVDQAGSPMSPTCTGGISYLIAVTALDAGGGSARMYRHTVTLGYMKYNLGTSYVTGFPATLPAPSNGSSQLVVRVGTTPATSGKKNRIIGGGLL